MLVPHILSETLLWPHMDAWVLHARPHYTRLMQDFGDCPVSNKYKFKEAILMVREKKYYLKDFHFYKSLPVHMRYIMPKILQTDYLNEYFDLKDDDYRFMYLGLDGTFTPMHHDVLKSFSWSFNLTGTKIWTFVSPDQERYLKDKLGNVLENIHDYDQTQFIDAAKIQVLQIKQEAGEIMFIPS